MFGNQPVSNLQERTALYKELAGRDIRERHLLDIIHRLTAQCAEAEETRDRLITASMRTKNALRRAGMTYFCYPTEDERDA